MNQQFDFFQNDKNFEYKKKPDPFFSYMGGKRFLRKKIAELAPKEFNRYFEPFLGGGAILFFLAHTKSFASDINSDLINAYQIVKTRPKELCEILKEHQKNYSKEHFYQIRKLHNLENLVERAARFIYLVNTCYASRYEVNKKNEFNGAFSSATFERKTPIFCEKNLFLCHEFLQSVKLSTQSYEKMQPKEGDFIYIDPPYHEALHRYNTEHFDERCQRELFSYCEKLTKKKVKFLLSNSSTDFIKALSEKSGFSVEDIYLKRYPIESGKDYEAKLSVREVLIKNY